MKILSILINENAVLAYRDLTANQSSVLHRVAAGKTTYDTGSPREQDIMDELSDLGLLASATYEVTPFGMNVANMIAKHGSYDARRMSRRPGPYANVKGDGRLSDVGDVGDLAGDLSGTSELRGGVGIGQQRANRDGSI